MDKPKVAISVAEWKTTIGYGMSAAPERADKDHAIAPFLLQNLSQKTNL